MPDLEKFTYVTYFLKCPLKVEQSFFVVSNRPKSLLLIIIKNCFFLEMPN